MENQEDYNSKTSFLKKIFKYFNSLLIIDKSIDLILIFVGLLAALGVESYQKSKKIEDDYVNILARSYDEIQLNNYKLHERDKSILGFLSITNDINDLASAGTYQYYDGINKLILLENSPFEIKVYQSISSDGFLNKTLYSEVLHLYDLLSQYASEMDNTRDKLKKYNYNYYRLFVKSIYKNSYLIQEYIDQNYFYNSITKSIPSLQNLSLDIEMTSERVLKSIKDELNKYETELSEKRGLSDYLSLAYEANFATQYEDAIYYSNEGLELINNSKNDTIENNSFEIDTYFGRFNKQLFHSKALSFIEDETKFSKEDIMMNLELWYNSGWLNESSYIAFLDYYYSIDKDLNNFLNYLNLYLEKYPDCNELKSRINYYKDFTSKKEVADLLDKLIKEEQNWRDWVNNKY